MSFRSPHLAWASDKPDPTIVTETYLNGRMPSREMETLQETVPCPWQHTLLQLLTEQPFSPIATTAQLREGPYRPARRSRGIGRHHGR
jgi:hypothetical protein